MGELEFWTPFNTRFLVLTRINFPNGITIGSAAFAGFTVRQTDRPTNHDTVCSSSPHLASAICNAAYY